ncbi:stage II sporulation protein P [Sporosarcina cyprini]|uniref:stage II sporulation protein P n=1 Tax=Sporosarcina cyprini TaxID=2910523 RepID=UPI001EDF2879|nr:stage II sporulation protein P [Sporosarcina cyprini]MCG3089301.1 stage II sporulation protein P [Sporosarcina cyprini]
MKEIIKLFENIKTDTSLSPEKDFVNSTELTLRKLAQKNKRKKNYYYISVVATTLALFVMAFFWLFILNGNQTINLASTISGQSNQLPLLLSEEPLVYIYHSHNRESFKQELNVDDARQAYDKNINITLVGERLSNSLKSNSVVTVHDTTDFFAIMKEKGISDTNAYLESREVVKNALKDYQELKMVIDVHRDTIPRKESTIEFNGENYARISFTFSSDETNKNNLKLAEAVHNEINQRYPELSRGIIVTESEQRSANYNQDLFDGNLLLSIGGIENTLDEEYRTTDILAEVIQVIIQNQH